MEKLYSCCGCKNKYIKDKFYKDSSRKQGITSRCKECSVKQYRKCLNSPKVKITNNLRRRLRDVFASNRDMKTILKYIGCSKEELVKHFENQFIAGMSWDNYGYGPGKWVIDHIRPISNFLKNGEDPKTANHYLNLRPCWFEENLIKSDNF